MKARVGLTTARSANETGRPKAAAIRACTVAKGYVYPNGLKAVIIPTWGSLSREDKDPISLIKIDFWAVPADQ